MSDRHEEDVKIVHQAISHLIEHFDAVQVFVTRCDENGTGSISLGAGNWYARRGHVSDWLAMKDEETRVDVRQVEEE